jgi:glycosyltransferase involved in cell wall biosynthesis
MPLYDGAMRVAHFVSGFPVLSETFVRDEIRAFAQAGIENFVVSLRPAPEGEGEGRVQTGDLNLLQTFYPEPSARAWLSAFRCDCRTTLRLALEMAGQALGHPSEAGRLALSFERIIEASRQLHGLGITHCHAHFAHYPAALAWGCSRLLGTTFSWNAHSYDLFKYSAGLRARIRDADLVFPVSEVNRRRILEESPSAARAQENIVLARCGIQLGEYPFDPEPVLTHAPLVLGVGRLVDTKGFDTLIQAAAILLRDGRDLQVRIIGEGLERPSLERSIRELGIEPSVELMGALDRETTRRFQSEASVIVQPCRSGRNGLDGIPVVLMEAMALGRPVISTRFAAIPELVEVGVTGRLTEPGDAGGLAKAIAGILDSPGEARRMVLSARTRIEAEFDGGRNYLRKAHLIRDLIRSSGA